MKKWNSPDIESLSFMSTESGSPETCVECNKIDHLKHAIGPDRLKIGKNNTGIPCPYVNVIVNPS